MASVVSNGTYPLQVFISETNLPQIVAAGAIVVLVVPWLLK